MFSYEVVVCSEAFNDLLCGFFVFEAIDNYNFIRPHMALNGKRKVNVCQWEKDFGVLLEFKT